MVFRYLDRFQDEGAKFVVLWYIVLLLISQEVFATIGTGTPETKQILEENVAFIKKYI